MLFFQTHNIKGREREVNDFNALVKHTIKELRKQGQLCIG